MIHYFGKYKMWVWSIFLSTKTYVGFWLTFKKQLSKFSHFQLMQFLNIKLVKAILVFFLSLFGEYIEKTLDNKRRLRPHFTSCVMLKVATQKVYFQLFKIFYLQTVKHERHLNTTTIVIVIIILTSKISVPNNEFHCVHQ